MIELFNQDEPLIYYDILNAVLEQECEISLKIASDSYKERLAEEFGNRKEPVNTKELYELFANARDIAIDEFIVNGEIRDKFPRYEEYLEKL